MARWMILALLAVTGCDDGSSDTDPDSDTSTGTETGTDTGTETETEDERARVKGVVTDADGKGVKVMINMCQDSCFTEFTKDDGSYEFRARFDPGDYWFYTINTAPDAKWANMSVAINIAEDADVVTQDVTVPEIGSTTDLPATAKEIETGAGVFMTIGADTVKLFDEEERRVGAVLVDSGDLPDVAYPDDVLAVYYLMPFEAEVRDGKKVPVRIVPPWKAVDGSDVDVYRGKYTWEKIGTYTVTNGEIAIEDVHYVSSLLVAAAK